MVTAEMTTPDERPRVRHGVWLLLLLAGGSIFLFAGMRLGWFLDALEAGRLSNCTFLLTWLVAGSVYSAIATLVLSLIAYRLSWRGTLLTLLAFLAPMLCGSYVAARKGIEQVFIVPIVIWWDHEEREFVLRALSTPTVADAFNRGDLRVLLCVDALWVKNEESWGKGQRDWGEIFIGPSRDYS
ncbi:MAG: hypothetical protein O7H41_00040 [Planctomycetota bacterium]|nr:hypothetical protein [Planctomycetota bacterium]